MRPLCRVAAPGLDFFCAEHVERQEKANAFFFGQLHELVCEIEFVTLYPAATHTDPFGFEEGVCHRAADQNRVGFFHQRLDHADFVRNFGAAQDDDERASPDCASSSWRYFSSFSIRKPMAACLTNLVMPAVEACARWAAPKASLT